MARYFSVLVAAIIGGCGAFVPTVDMKQLPPETRHAVRSMPILDQNMLKERKYSILTIVEGNSCQNLLTDPPATRTAAIEQVKFMALEAGANAISSVQCSGREGTSVHTNCWELISCTANALKVDEQQ